MRHFRQRLFQVSIFAAIFLSSAFLFRILAEQLAGRLDPFHVNTFQKRRWKALEEELHDADLQGKKVFLFLGLSEVELGVNPARVLVQSGVRNAEGFNIGFRALPVSAIPVLIERVSREVKARGASEVYLLMKPPLAAITDQARTYLEGYETDDVMLEIADFTSFSGLMRAEPARGLELLFRKALFGSSSSSTLSYWLYQVALRGAARNAGESLITNYDMIEEGHWPKRSRGKTLWEIFAEKRADAIEAHRLKSVDPSEIRWLQARYGLLDPAIDARALRSLLSVEVIIRRLGIKVAIFDFQDAFDLTGKRTKEARATITAIGRKMASAFGVELKSLDLDFPLSETDFLDGLHLGESGQRKIDRALARLVKEIASDLQAAVN